MLTHQPPAAGGDLLFVYGTLRPNSGHPMSQWLAARSLWVGEGHIEGLLYRVSYYPALVQGAGRVRGDVIQLNAATAVETWERLDAFEQCLGLPDDEYCRNIALVKLTDDSFCQAWVYWYLGDVSGLQRVVDGDWLRGTDLP